MASIVTQSNKPKHLAEHSCIFQLSEHMFLCHAHKTLDAQCVYNIPPFLSGHRRVTENKGSQPRTRNLISLLSDRPCDLRDVIRISCAISFRRCHCGFDYRVVVITSAFYFCTFSRNQCILRNWRWNKLCSISVELNRRASAFGWLICRHQFL